jgi:hypothetical protein
MRLANRRVSAWDYVNVLKYAPRKLLSISLGGFFDGLVFFMHRENNSSETI